jgi:hypothetical protein
LGGTIAVGAQIRENLTTSFDLIPTGDALKLVYRNPGGLGASAGGADIVMDRVECNATLGQTLDWQPGATSMGSAPAPGSGQILERSASCGDTNSPSDFRLAAEPGIPAILLPTVTIPAPIQGQTATGGQTFPVRWTMQDDAFARSYLRVWLNVTCHGTTTTLLAGATGTTSVDWNVPDVNAPGTRIEVEVVNPSAEKGNAVMSVDVIPATPYSAYVAIVVVLVIAAFIILAFVHVRRQAKPPPTPALAPPASPEIARRSAPGMPPATKMCPRCQGTVQATDNTCAHCGYSFLEPRT